MSGKTATIWTVVATADGGKPEPMRFYPTKRTAWAYAVTQERYHGKAVLVDRMEVGCTKPAILRALRRFGVRP